MDYKKYNDNEFRIIGNDVQQSKTIEIQNAHFVVDKPWIIREPNYDYLIDLGDGRGSLGAGASTTGNIYGIYDMSGGNSEYVMANQSSSTFEYIWYPKSSGFVNQVNSKYIDNYLSY